jgi:hypothetical protein
MTRKVVTLELTEAQEQFVRRVLGLAEELEQLADTAPDGTVLDACEAAVLTGGRDVQRQLLQQAVQRRIDAAEKKGRRCGRAPAGVGRRTAGPASGRC